MTPSIRARHRWTVVLALVALWSGLARGQGVGGPNQSLAVGRGVEEVGGEAGAFRLSFWSTAEDRDLVIDKDRGGPTNTKHNPGFKTTIFRQFVSVDYAITDELSTFVEGSWVRIDAKGPGGAADYEDGFGDTRALLRWTVLAIPHHHDDAEPPGAYGLHWGEAKIAFGAGVSLPTGEPKRFTESSSPQSIASLQRGTGTFDPIANVVFSQSVSGGTLFSSVAARFPVMESRFEYEVGTAIQTSVGAAVPVSATFDVVPKVSYLYNAPDRFGGHHAQASGGHWISIAPGIRWRITDHVDFETSVDVPVYRDLRDPQLDAPARLAVGISYRF
jgi:hypothetical protein